jgi:hypothetical protein
MAGGWRFRPGKCPFRAGGGRRLAVQARETAFSGRRWTAGSGSSPGNALFGPEMAGGWRFRPGKRPFRAGDGRRVAVQARETAFSGRRWPAVGGSGPGNALFGPEVAGGWRFRPGERPFRAGGGRRVAIQARGTAFSGRRWPAGSGSSPGNALFGPEVAGGKHSLGGTVVRGVISSTPNSKIGLFRRQGCCA